MTGTNRTIRSQNDAIADTQSFLLAHGAPTADDAHQHAATPPAYTPTMGDGELTVDAEALQEGKVAALYASSGRLMYSHGSTQEHGSNTQAGSVVNGLQTQDTVQPDSALQCSRCTNPAAMASDLGRYSTKPAMNPDLVGVRLCSILRDRPAMWLVKRTARALSSLAASVLIKEGLIRPEDLRLISQYQSSEQEPMDPISGVLLGIFEFVEEMALGLAAGPVEVSRQATPVLRRYNSERQGDSDCNKGLATARGARDGARAAGQVALSTGKGIGRIITGGLKSPMLVMHGATRGFHNLPRLYGDEVRQYTNVTGLRSGLVVSAKSFGYGFSDGVRDLIAKPIDGAKQNGILGFGTGLLKGCTSVWCKPTAGLCGLVGYSSIGVYRSMRAVRYPREDDLTPLVLELGTSELQQSTDAVQEYVVRVYGRSEKCARPG